MKPCQLITLCLGLLVGCNGAQQQSIVPAIPESIRQIQAFSVDNLYVTVSVNDARARRYDLAGQRSIPIEGITRDSDNTVVVNWYENFENRNLLLAHWRKESRKWIRFTKLIRCG